MGSIRRFPTPGHKVAVRVIAAILPGLSKRSNETMKHGRNSGGGKLFYPEREAQLLPCSPAWNIATTLTARVSETLVYGVP